MANVNKQEELYNKAKDSIESDDIMGDDAFTIYADRLFTVLYHGSIMPYEREVVYSSFINILKRWINTLQKYDQVLFKQDVKKLYAHGKLNSYYIFFGVNVRGLKQSTFPIKRTIRVGEVKFERVSLKAISKVGDGTYIQSLQEKHNKFPPFSIKDNYIFFRASVKAHKDAIAVNRVSWAFNLFTASVAIAQQRYASVRHIGGNGSLKSRKPLRQPYLFYLDKPSRNPTVNIYASESFEQSLSDEAIDIMENINKVRAYKRYLKIISSKKPSPIETRIRDSLLEFDRALDATDPHLRALAMWRCLETATRTADAQARKEKEIISIIAAYSDKDAWKHQGEIVLKSRNSFVHEGESFNSQNRDSHLTWLQSYASASLSLLIWMRQHKIGNTLEEIDFFFDVYPKPLNGLNVAVKMLHAKRALELERVKYNV